MKTFKQHLLEDGVAAIANSVGTTDKASVAGEPIKKAGIKTMRRNAKPFTEGKVQPSDILKKIHKPENHYQLNPDHNTALIPDSMPMKPYPEPQKKKDDGTRTLKKMAANAGFPDGSFFRKISPK